METVLLLAAVRWELSTRAGTHRCYDLQVCILTQHLLPPLRHLQLWTNVSAPPHHFPTLFKLQILREKHRLSGSHEDDQL